MSEANERLKLAGKLPPGIADEGGNPRTFNLLKRDRRRSEAKEAIPGPL